MMHVYDNIEDVKQKLMGTMCYYDNKAVLVKNAFVDDENGKLMLSILNINNKTPKFVPVDDPLLNYTEFNLGYVNFPGYSTWFCRIPRRQYHQGLKAEQMERHASNMSYILNSTFAFNSNVTKMMENIYPKFIDVEIGVKSGDATVIAFHRDFAASWDNVHKDLVIEYKGNQVGFRNEDGEFKFMEGCDHLHEALKEAIA